LSDIIENGFKGYANYTNQELIDEWEESKDEYNYMIKNEKQYYNVNNQYKKVKEVA
jgi:hypothetical protein